MKLKKIISVILISILIFQFFGTLSIAATEGDSDEEIEFKDEKFKKCLINNAVDANNDGKIQKEELKNITNLNISSDVKDISGIEDATNLKDISFNGYEANNLDLSPLKSLTTIEKLTFYCEYTNMYGFDFLKNSKNLKEIYLYNLPHSFDFNNFSNLSNLESICVNINQNDGNDNQFQNLSSLKNLTKLSSLDLYAGYGTIHTKELAELKQIKTLKIDGNIDSYSNIYSIPNLTYLKLGGHSGNITTDLKSIGNLTKLETLELGGNIENILNINELNNASSLKCLKINMHPADGYDEVETYKNDMDKEQKFVDSVQALNCKNIQILSAYSKSYIGSIPLGKNKTLKFEDISPLVKAFVTPENKLYNSKFKIIDDSNNNNSHIKVDNTNKTITISANSELGKQQETITVNTNYENNESYRLEITLLWNNVNQGDTNKTINIPDANLKEYLLNNYDIDNDKKITENDMTNIVSLNIQNENISSLEGLQYASNLKKLTVRIKNNADISQISKLTNLDTIYITYGDLKDYLKNLNNLKSVSLSFVTLDANNLNNVIESFNYSGSNLSNIESLENYSNLNYISIYNYNDYDESKKINYNFVEKLNKLSYFTASDNNGTIDMEKFNNLEKLYTIQLSKFTLTNLNLLKEYSPKKSYIIGLDSCKVNDISFVKNFTSFYSLNLRNNSITDISPLNGIKISGGNYIDLKGNAINPNEEKNAKTIQYFKDNNITYYIDDYDDSEEIEFKDENFKKCLLKSNYPKIDTNNDGKIQKGELKDITRLTISEDVKDISGIENATNLKEISFDCYQKNDMDLSPLKNLTNIERITFMSEFTKMYGFDFLSNSKNFKEICLYNLPHSFDFNNFSNLSNLESICVNINQNDGNDNQFQNLSSLKNLTKLSSLDLYAGYGTIHTKELAELKQIKTLKIDGNIDSYSNIYSIPNLTYLKLGGHSGNITTDLKSIGNLTKLETLELNGNIKNILNIKELNNVSSLKLLKLDLNTYYDYKFHYSNVESYKEYMKKEQEFVDSLQTLNCEKIQICPSSKSYVGSIQLGQKKTIKFEDISPLIKAIVTPGNKLYNSNFEISTNSNDSHIKVDNTNKTITINSNGKVGEQSEDIIAKIDYGNYNYCTTNIPILWKNITQGDTTKKIDIPDKNLKECLLNNYDIDNDKEITENDMVNIVSLDIQNKNISVLTGLEYCKNLKEIDADSNNITSLEPIKNLTGIHEFYFSNNKITDISPLKNLDSIWGSVANNYITDISALKEFKASNLDCMDFRGNYIRFDDGSENLSTLNELSKNGKINDEYTKNYLFMHSQKYGSVGERNDVLNITDSLKNKFIECGIDSNNDKKITKGELNDFNQGDHVGGEELFEPYKMNLSGLNLKSSDINCLKYLSCIDELDLSNNKIQDVSALQYIKHLNTINLSKNNINVSTLNNITANTIDLSYNNLNSIEGISSIKPINCFGGWFAGDGYIKCLKINLSNNNIKDITPINGLLDKLYQIDFSNNEIKNISILKEYNITYDEDADYDNPEYDFSNNYIDINSEETKAIVEKYKNTKIIIKLDNQLTKVEKTDTKTGAIIETNTKVVPENVVLEIDKLDTASETNKNLVKIMNTLPNTTTNTKYEVFNIKLVDNAKKEVQPNGNVTVYLPIPNDYGSKVKIYNIDPTNSKTPYTLLDTSIETIDNKKYAKFKTTHFSYYSMVNSELIGDVNGDGKVNITDVALINSHVKKVKILTGEELSRADVNNDGKVNITDVALVNSHVKKVKLLW